MFPIIDITGSSGIDITGSSCIDITGSSCEIFSKFGLISENLSVKIFSVKLNITKK